MNNEKGVKAPKTNSERQATLKQARRAAGLVRFELYATPAHKALIIAFAQSLEEVWAAKD